MIARKVELGLSPRSCVLLDGSDQREGFQDSCEQRLQLEILNHVDSWEATGELTATEGNEVLARDMER